MPHLRGLEGTSGAEIEAEYFTKSSQIKNIIDKGLSATAADYNGAINIWKDDAGFIRCESMQWLISLEKKRFRTIKEVKVWADKWLKKIHNE